MSSHPRSLIAGSIHSSDIVLTSAFHEQYHKLSWFQFCMGRISKKWAAAASDYLPSIDAPLWSSLLVSILWGFTRTMWRKRNELIHQSTNTAETDGRILSLHHQVTQYYSSYSTNPDFLLPRFHDLFTCHTLSQSLQLSPDFLQCWISSVQTAIRATEICEHACILRALVEYPQGNLEEIQQKTLQSTQEEPGRPSGPQGLDVRHWALHSQPCTASADAGGANMYAVSSGNVSVWPFN